MIVFLNAHAGHGRAAAKWEAVRPELESRLGPFELVLTETAEGVREAVARAVREREGAVVAAGGDGTVNLLVNAMMTVEGGTALKLGAVGLGSSNDFHKPVGPHSRIDGIPARIDCGHAREVDVMRVDYCYGDGADLSGDRADLSGDRADLSGDRADPSGDRAERADGLVTKYAIINASMGITAEANYNFNHPTGLTRVASRLSVDAAIVASVVKTLATYRDIPCRIRVDGRDEGEFMVSNLGVVKNPHFAGSFCYDTPIAPDDGTLGINLCERLNRFQVFTTLAALSRRRFRGRPKTRHWIAERVAVDAREAFSVEMDGEVVRARSAEFTVLPRRVRCCV